MAIKLFLNSKTIIDRVFPVVGKNAYDATEVDKFLDMIIQDYRTVEANVLIVKKDYDSLTEKNKNLEKEKRALEIEVERYKARFVNINPGDNVTTDNIELVRRINALEKFLWAHGFNPNTIK